MAEPMIFFADKDWLAWPGIAGARAPLLAVGCALSAALFFAAAPVFARAALTAPVHADFWAVLLTVEAASLFLGLTLARKAARFLSAPQALLLHGVILGVALALLPQGHGAEPIAPLALAPPLLAAAATFGWLEGWLGEGRVRGISTKGLRCAAAGFAACVLIETCFDPDEQAHLWIALYAGLCVIFALAAPLLWREARAGAPAFAGWGVTAGLVAALVIAPAALALLAIEDFWL